MQMCRVVPQTKRFRTTISSFKYKGYNCVDLVHVTIGFIFYFTLYHDGVYSGPSMLIKKEKKKKRKKKVVW